MLFTRIALPLLGLSASVLAIQSSDFTLKKRQNDGEAFLSYSLMEVTGLITSAGEFIAHKCEENASKGAQAIVDAVVDPLEIVSTHLGLLAEDISIRQGEFERTSLDEQNLGKITGALLDAVATAHLPLYLEIKKSNQILDLLTPHLGLASSLESVLKATFDASAGIRDVTRSNTNIFGLVSLKAFGDAFEGVFELLDV